MFNLFDTGFQFFYWGNLLMIVIGGGLIYLGISRKMEPLLLLPIGFGILLVNLPLGGMIDYEFELSHNGIPGKVISIEVNSTTRLSENDVVIRLDSGEVIAPVHGRIKQLLVSPGQEVLPGQAVAVMVTTAQTPFPTTPVGLFSRIFQFGIMWQVIPPLIFLSLGALTDFGPMIANPRTLLLGAAAQFGVYFAFFAALATNFFMKVGFTIPEAASIGIIGGAEGPTTIFVTAALAPHIIGATAVACYSYMALVPVIQPPIIRLLTTKQERAIYMKPQLREVSNREKILFPVIAAVVVILFVPLSAPLIGMFMLGNLFSMSGVVERLSKTASGAFIDILTIFLTLAIGATMTAENFLLPRTLLVLVLGLVAFATATAAGVIMAKILNIFSREKINPMIGAAGVSAVPMAARVVQVMGQKANPRNFLLMHAMGPNVAGAIGAAIAGGVFLGMIR
ncbi:MAG: sodium ion-translocating decarboxylase subunit beta [Chloroflexi bacterium]|nr:sodium ion-translocating decarboxylase subunit beta [Chloroflexota bacterium]